MANFAPKRRNGQTGSGTNATLTFKANGKTHTAQVRVTRTAYTYGVNSTESHARLDRGFYPHRRALGQFTVTMDFLGYHEYRNFMNWLRLYAESLFTGQMGTQKGATTMDIMVPSRNFHKVGILTTGIDDHDHVGSMVFSPTLTFMMIKDFNDPGTAIVSARSTSQFLAPAVQNVETAGTNRRGEISMINDNSGTGAFYPLTVQSYKDMDSAIYDIPDPSIVQGPTAPGHSIPVAQ